MLNKILSKLTSRKHKPPFKDIDFDNVYNDYVNHVNHYIGYGLDVNNAFDAKDDICSFIIELMKIINSNIKSSENNYPLTYGDIDNCVKKTEIIFDKYPDIDKDVIARFIGKYLCKSYIYQEWYTKLEYTIYYRKLKNNGNDIRVPVS